MRGGKDFGAAQRFQASFATGSMDARAVRRGCPRILAPAPQDAYFNPLAYLRLVKFIFNLTIDERIDLCTGCSSMHITGQAAS